MNKLYNLSSMLLSSMQTRKCRHYAMNDSVSVSDLPAPQYAFANIHNVKQTPLAKWKGEIERFSNKKLFEKELVLPLSARTSGLSSREYDKMFVMQSNDKKRGMWAQLGPVLDIVFSPFETFDHGSTAIRH